MVKVFKGHFHEGPGGHRFSLDSGICLGDMLSPRGDRFGQALLDDDSLARGRTRAGWTLEHARQFRAGVAESELGMVPAALATDEAFQTMIDSARENYRSHAFLVHVEDD